MGFRLPATRGCAGTLQGRRSTITSRARHAPASLTVLPPEAVPALRCYACTPPLCLASLLTPISLARMTMSFFTDEAIRHMRRNLLNFSHALNA